MKTQMQLAYEILSLELEMFHNMQNCGSGAADLCSGECFRRVRECQLGAWNHAMLESYFDDICCARAEGRNLLCQQYAWLLLSERPAEYGWLEGQLEKPSMEKRWLIDWISRARESFWNTSDEMRGEKYPAIWAVDAENEKAGWKICLHSELMMYSVETLRRYAAYLEKLTNERKSMEHMILRRWRDCFAAIQAE